MVIESGSGQFVDGPDPVGHTSVYEAREEVNKRVDLLESFSNSRWSETYTFIQNYHGFMEGLSLPETSINDIAFPEIVPIDVTLRPKIGEAGIDTDIPDHDIKIPNLKDPVSFTGITIPTPSFSTPAWDNPEKPVVADVPLPGDSPTVDAISYPSAPIITLPDVPVLSDIQLPSPPDITLPVFDERLPEDIGDLTNTFNYDPEAYNSDIWADLLKKVLTDIRNGGTGLDVDVEQELYDRALYRQQAENDRMYQEIEATFGSRGFDLPSGALTSALMQASSQVTKNNTEINGQIMIDQAKLAQENTHFMVQKGYELEGILRDFYNQSESRALEAQKVIAQSAIDVYNAVVNAFNGKIEKYKSAAIAFESITKAAMSEIEIYKGKIEAASVSTEVQKNLVDIYNSQLGALDTQMKIYATEMEGAKIAADIQASKISVFKTQIEAYVARIDANKSLYDVYATEMQGEAIKADTFRSKVEAYTSEVEATKAEASVLSLEAEVNLKNNALLLDKYKAELSGYIASVDAKSKSIEAQIGGFKAEASAYEAETGALGMYYESKYKEMEVALLEVDTKVKKAMAEITATVEGYTALKKLEGEGHKALTNVGAQLVSSAMNAVNTSLSYGGTTSTSYGTSHSLNSSLGETHSFDETKTT